jgi:hypothetical protein
MESYTLNFVERWRMSSPSTLKLADLLARQSPVILAESIIAVSTNADLVILYIL